MSSQCGCIAQTGSQLLTQSSFPSLVILPFRTYIQQFHTYIPHVPPSCPSQLPLPLATPTLNPHQSLPPTCIFHRLPAVLGSRDQSLFLFRSLGKVFYCKRSTASAAQATRNTPTSAPSSCQLPAHLHMHERTPLEANPEVHGSRWAGRGRRVVSREVAWVGTAVALSSLPDYKRSVICNTNVTFAVNAGGDYAYVHRRFVPS